MAYKSDIEWTDATWNPWHGCHKVSQGCKNCYMFRDKARYGQDPNVVVRSADKTFYAPLKWQAPGTIFTCSWSDFFIEEADAWRDEAFAIMALTPQHTYQVLTKRPERMLEYLTDPSLPVRVQNVVDNLEPNGIWKFAGHEPWVIDEWPLPNVWLGVSVEDQTAADERIPLLLQTPAAIPWLSIEPLLGPVMIPEVSLKPLGWVVVGGESGPRARPMHPNWARDLRDQCVEAKVPFFFKQWGEWAPDDDLRASIRVGKKKAGRTLDGRTWNEMPEVSR